MKIDKELLKVLQEKALKELNKRFKKKTGKWDFKISEEVQSFDNFEESVTYAELLLDYLYKNFSEASEAKKEYVMDVKVGVLPINNVYKINVERTPKKKKENSYKK